jgi:hypothetical protein
MGARWSLAAASTAAVAIGLSVVWMLRESEEWEQFAERRHCKAVAYMQGDKSWPLDLEQRSIMPATPEGPGQRKTGYACDDGFTYWR